MLGITKFLAWAIVALVCTAPSPLCASAISLSLRQGADHIELRALVRAPDSDDAVHFAIPSSGLRGISWMSRATQISDTWFELPSPRKSPTGFRVQPDPLVPDRVYPSFVAGPLVGIVNLDYWILEQPLRRQAIRASFPSFFIGSGCKTFAETSVDRGTGTGVEGRGRYAALATDDSVCQVVDGLTVIDTGTTPEWIRKLAISEMLRFARVFAQGFQIDLPTPTLYLHADLNPGQRSRYRGEAAWRHIIFLRFLGDAWTKFDDLAADRISKFVAHEVVHLWLGRRFYQASEARNAWFHEGAAEYLSLTAQENLVDPSSGAALDVASERLTSCLRALNDKSLSDQEADRGSAPYDCGYALQWLLSLHDQRVHERSIWERWRGYLASRPNREISWDGFLAWGASENSNRALVSPLFASMRFDQRVRALRTRLADLDLRVATPRLDDPRTIRRLVLFHLLDQTCIEGSIRFTIHDDGVELHTDDRCGALSGNPRVRSLEGYDLLSPTKELHDHISDICLEKGDVTFAGTDGGRVASVSCERKLPPLPRGIRISHGTDSG